MGLGWSDIRGLAGEGVTLASHTRNHPIPSHIDAEKVDFAYPSDEHGFPFVAVLRRLGISAAFTTERSHANSVQMHRINVGGRRMLGVVRAQMLFRPRWLSSPGH